MDTTQSQEGSSRLMPPDLLRGLLIALMALDHANFHIAQQHSSGEYWGGHFPVYDTALGFLTRYITHLCAPGFFFLMGVSMILFQSSRQMKSWQKGEVRRHFLLRGMVLILVQFFLDINQVWTTRASTGPLWYGGVLAALGAGMILCVPLLDLKPVYLGAIAGFLFVVMEILTPSPLLWGRNFDRLAGVLLVYGGGGEDFWVNYPLLAWAELIVCGMIFGRILLKDRSKAYRWAGGSSLLLLVGFTIIRTLNSFGTIRPLPVDSWMDFLSVVKYPPSLAFVCLTMGINLFLLWVFSRGECEQLSERHPLLVFGRTPLFSYVVHIMIYLILGRLLAPEGTSLGVMYLFWLGGLAILYLPANWYGIFKSRQPPRAWVRYL